MKIVLANGVFDPLHYGHVLHLQQAAKLGMVVVGLTKDAFVNKGPKRPVFDEDQREHVLRALSCVSDVVRCADAMDALILVKPDIFVKGKDYRGKIEEEHENYCRSSGIKIVFTDTPLFSSTKLLSCLSQ